MSATSPIITYTGQKIRKVRWLPREAGELGESSIFVTGSYDDEVNSLVMWEYGRAPTRDEDDSIMADDGRGRPLPSINEPKAVHTRNLSASVTEMQFVDRDSLAVCLSDGSLQVLRYSPYGIEPLFKMESLHSCLLPGQTCSCNCMAVNQFTPHTVYTGGEDGTVCVVSTDHGQLVGKIGEEDTTSINAITCISHSELLAAYSSGQLKLWNVKDDPRHPAKTIALSKEMTSVHSLDRHPNQPHLIVAGCGNGCVCFWDLRQEKQPINMLEAHSSEVWEVRFHPLHPSYMFSCSQDGSLWQWSSETKSPYADTIFNSSTIAALGKDVSMMETQHQTTRGWLQSSCQGLEVHSVLPKDGVLSVNSYDICNRHLVAVTDQEALFTIPNLLL